MGAEAKGLNKLATKFRFVCWERSCSNLSTLIRVDIEGQRFVASDLILVIAAVVGGGTMWSGTRTSDGSSETVDDGVVG